MIPTHWKRSRVKMLVPLTNKKLFDSDWSMFIFLTKQLRISQFRKNISVVMLLIKKQALKFFQTLFF